MRRPELLFFLALYAGASLVDDHHLLGALGDEPSVVCGTLAAIIGPVVEIVLVEIDVFAYHEPCDGLSGVAPWLVPL